MGGVCGAGGVDVVCDVCVVRRTCGLSGACKCTAYVGYRSPEVRVGGPGLAVGPVPARSGRRGGSGSGVPPWPVGQMDPKYRVYLVDPPGGGGGPPLRSPAGLAGTQNADN
eukprot:gene25531-biopygen15042